MLAGSEIERDASGPSYGIYAYTAREWDPEIGLYYYRARYYDPKVGRFLSEDPIGFRGGINFYRYVENRPATLIDPLGLLGMHNCPGQADGATLCCKDKKWTICTDFKWWFSQTEGYRQCMREHEEYHVWQMQWDPKPKCGECTGEPCTDQRHPPGTATQRECMANLNMYVCMKKHAPEYRRRMAQISRFIGKICLSSPNFGGFM